MYYLRRLLLCCWNLRLSKWIECRIRGPRLRSPPPMSLQSFCFTFSSELAIFPYVPPSPSNRHSSRAFGDVVLSASLCRLYRSFVFWGTFFGEFLCLLRLSFLWFFGKDVVWCVLVCVRRVARARCRGTACVRYGSWFQLSNLITNHLKVRVWAIFLVPRTYNSATRTIPIYTNHLKVRVWAIFFLLPRTYNSANRTIPIYTNHLKVRVWAIFFSATYLQFRQ